MKPALCFPVNFNPKWGQGLKGSFWNLARGKIRKLPGNLAGDALAHIELRCLADTVLRFVPGFKEFL